MNLLDWIVADLGVRVDETGIEGKQKPWYLAIGLLAILLVLFTVALVLGTAPR